SNIMIPAEIMNMSILQFDNQG
ncbi:MAG: hypothetical protein RL619_394, partial [Bacteroidota bacterium]